MSGAKSLCSGCQELDLPGQFKAASAATRRYIRDLGSKKHKALSSVVALQTSARSCRCCDALSRGLDEVLRFAPPSVARSTHDQRLLLRVMAFVVKNPFSGRGGTELHDISDRHVEIQLGFENEDLEDIYATMRLATARPDINDFSLDLKEVEWHGSTAHHAVFHCRVVPPELSLAAAADMVATWERECDAFHDQCEADASGGGLPDRVLDLGVSSLPSLKLLETANEQERFIALSYCWGKRRQTTTTTVNIKEFKEGIDEHSLPQTIQDAVAFTRRLGIRYLWVDALCIVQDDAADWAVQSGKMADVYGNAQLTLCAANAASVHGGFLRPRAPQVTGPVGAVPPSDEELYLVPGTRVGGVKYDNPEIVHNEIGTRAWCFQERLVAPRKVFFLASQIAWECRKVVAFESGVKRVKERGTFELVRQRLGGDYSAKLHLDDLGWSEIVEIYSTRKLTKITDRLPALSAVAALYAERVARRYEKRPRYVAGHWEDDLVSSLLWRSVRDVEDVSSMETGWWWAPSWSWAASRKPVLFGIPADRPLWSDVKCDVMLSGSNAFGPISGASLSLSAPVLEATCSRTGDDGPLDVVCLKQYHLRVSKDDQFRGGIQAGVYFDADEPPESLSVLILSTVGARNSDGSPNLSGLLLQAAKEKSNSSYRRLGTFWNCNLDLGGEKGDIGGIDSALGQRTSVQLS